MRRRRGTRLEARRPDRRRGAPTLVFLHEGLGSVSRWRDFPARRRGHRPRRARLQPPRLRQSDPVRAPWPLDLHARRGAARAADLLDAGGDRRRRPRRSLRRRVDRAGVRRRDRRSASRVVPMAPHVFVEDVSVRASPHARRGVPTHRPAGEARRDHARRRRHLPGLGRRVARPGFRAWDLEGFLPRVKVPCWSCQGETTSTGRWPRSTPSRRKQRPRLAPRAPRRTCAAQGPSPRRRSRPSPRFVRADYG